MCPSGRHKAARKAGYKQPQVQGAQNYEKLREPIDARLVELEDKRITKADEVLKTLTPVCGSLEPYDGRERPEGMQAGRKVRPQGAAGITRTAKAGEDGSILIDNSSVSLRR